MKHALVSTSCASISAYFLALRNRVAVSRFTTPCTLARGKTDSRPYSCSCLSWPQLSLLPARDIRRLLWLVTKHRSHSRLMAISQAYNNHHLVDPLRPHTPDQYPVCAMQAHRYHQPSSCLGLAPPPFSHLDQRPSDNMMSLYRIVLSPETNGRETAVYTLLRPRTTRTFIWPRGGMTWKA